MRKRCSVGTVYRALDERTKKLVALKKVIMHNEKQDGVSDGCTLRAVRTDW